MKLARKSIALLISSLIGTVGLLPAPIMSPSQLASAQTRQNNPAIQPPMNIPQATFADLWRVDHTFQSTIHMKNLLTFRSIQVTPALYMSDGTEYDLLAVTLGPSAMADVDVNMALMNAPPAITSHLSHFGSAALKYTHFAPGVIVGELTMVDAPRSLVFSSPFQMMTGPPNAANMPVTLEGMWWKHDANVGGYINLTNTTDRPTNVSVQVIGEHGTVLPPEKVSLGPHTEEILDLDSLTSGLPNGATQSGGLRVQYQGQMGDVQVSGGLENPSEGYSANVPFWQHEPGGPAKSANSVARPLTLAAVGIMAGQPDAAQGFPSGTRFMPYLALRNTTGEPLKLNPTLYVTNAAKTSSFSLPPEVLAPYASRQVDMADRLKSLRLRNFDGTLNMAVSYAGAVADLLMAAGAVDQTGSFVFAVIPQVIEDGVAKDSNWMVGDGYDSMLSLWNPSNEPEDLVATFSYPDGSGGYKLPVHLDPYGSMNIDVVSLIAQQKPDVDGNVIPRGTMQGRVIVSSPKGLSTKIKLAVSSAAFNVTTATCCPNCVCCFGTFSTYMSPSSATVAATDTTQLHFMDNEWGGTNDDSCDATWTSDNTSDATVSAPSCTSGNGATVTGVAASGGVTITASEVVNPSGMICNCSPNCTPYETSDSATVTVKPKITGDNVVWFFGNLTLSGYTTSAQLTANGGNSSTTWNITAGANNITVSSFTGSSISVLSSGTTFSSGVGDTKLTATSNGQTSDPFSMTTRVPYRLIPGSVNTACNSTYGYLTTANYEIQDQLQGAMPAAVPLNENWTTPVGNDYPGGTRNWTIPSPGNTTTTLPDYSHMADHMSGGFPPNPIPVPICDPSNNTPVQHIGQEWRIGSLATGFGSRVQTDTVQQYVGRAAHLAITSPAL